MPMLSQTVDVRPILKAESLIFDNDINNIRSQQTNYARRLYYPRFATKTQQQMTETDRDRNADTQTEEERRKTPM